MPVSHIVDLLIERKKHFGVTYQELLEAYGDGANRDTLNWMLPSRRSDPGCATLIRACVCLGCYLAIDKQPVKRIDDLRLVIEAHQRAKLLRKYPKVWKLISRVWAQENAVPKSLDLALDVLGAKLSIVEMTKEDLEHSN